MKIYQRFYLIIAVLLLTQSNLFSQKTYTQGVFETDEVFSQRVINDFGPTIDYIEKCEVSSAIFPGNVSTTGFKPESCLEFVIKPTKFKISGDLNRLKWPEIIVKIASEETKTSIYTDDICVLQSNFELNNNKRTSDIKFRMPFAFKQKVKMWEKIANEKIIIKFYYKSVLIGKFKLCSISSILDSTDNKVYKLYPEKF